MGEKDKAKDQREGVEVKIFCKVYFAVYLGLMLYVTLGQLGKTMPAYSVGWDHVFIGILTSVTCFLAGRFSK